MSKFLTVSYLRHMVAYMTLSQQDFEHLLAAGVPLAGQRATSLSIDFEKISEIMCRALDDRSDPKTYDAIRGWLIAMRDHYPSIFSKFLAKPQLAAALDGPVTGRDIKLRRIALSHIGKIA
jgi:hypothetical protein